MLRLAATILVSLWAAVYTGSLALALWRQKQYRGGVGVALLALAVLVAPTLVELYVQAR